jgi:protein gp37
MAAHTNISWTDHTFNPWIGCSKVSPGCANCYAAEQNKLRKWTAGGEWGKERRRTSPANWKGPVKWNADAQGGYAVAGFDQVRPRVFCASLADWLDDEVPVEWLADLLSLIRATPNLDWLLLTKRPENFAPRMDAVLAALRGPMSQEWAQTKAFVSNMRTGWQRVTYASPGVGRENYWIGATVENQEYAERRIPQLLSIPARVRFLSVEPMLGPVDIMTPLLGHKFHGFEGVGMSAAAMRARGEALPWIEWVICGGESGPKRRPFEIEWAQELAEQCERAGAAFFMKQAGGLRSGERGQIPEWLWNLKQFPQP